MSKIEEILKLKKLLDSGLITKDDFERLKSKVFEEPKISIEIEKIKNSDFTNNFKNKRNSLSNENSKKCQQCGSLNSVDSKICGFCKTDLVNFQPKSQSVTSEINNPDKQDKDYGLSKYIYLIALAFGLFIVFVSIKSYFFITPEAEASKVDSTVVKNKENQTIQTAVADTQPKPFVQENIDSSEIINKDDVELNQLELNIKSGEKYDVADKKLNIVYKKIMTVLNDDEKKKLIHEERDWLIYREHYCDEQSGDMKGGTMYNYTLNTCLEEITNKRIKELEVILYNKTGDRVKW